MARCSAGKALGVLEDLGLEEGCLSLLDTESRGDSLDLVILRFQTSIMLNALYRMWCDFIFTNPKSTNKKIIKIKINIIPHHLR